MKALTPVLFLSLAANLTLAALVYSRRTPPAPASAVHQAEAPAAAAPAAKAKHAASAGASTEAVSSAQSLPEDIAYVARLRAGGVPPDIIRLLLAQQISARYRDRVRALLPDDPDKYWVGLFRNSLQDATPEVRAKIRAIYREMEDEIRALLGDSPETLGPYERRLWDQMAGYLPGTKIQQIEAIRRDYDELAGNVRTRSRSLVLKADREQLRLIERERRADLAAVLTPEELLEHDLRDSATANNIRNRLTYFEPSEEEFRAIAKIQLAIDQQFGLVALSGAEQDRKREAEKNFPDQVAAVLTPERMAEFKATIDGAFSETISFTNAYNLDRSVAVGIITLKQQMWQQVDELDRAGLPAGQRTANLKELETEANRQLLAKLGPDVLEKYKKSGAGWLRRLTSTPPRS